MNKKIRNRKMAKRVVRKFEARQWEYYGNYRYRLERRPSYHGGDHVHIQDLRDTNREWVIKKDGSRSEERKYNLQMPDEVKDLVRKIFRLELVENVRADCGVPDVDQILKLKNNRYTDASCDIDKKIESNEPIRVNFDTLKLFINDLVSKKLMKKPSVQEWERIRRAFYLNNEYVIEI